MAQRGQSSRTATSVASALAPSRQGLDEYDEIEAKQVMEMRRMYQVRRSQSRRVRTRRVLRFSRRYYHECRVLGSCSMQWECRGAPPESPLSITRATQLTDDEPRVTRDCGFASCLFDAYLYVCISVCECQCACVCVCVCVCPLDCSSSRYYTSVASSEQPWSSRSWMRTSSSMHSCAR